MQSQGDIVINKIGLALFATIQTDLTSAVLMQFRQSLLKQIEKQSINFVIVDFSGLALLDAAECDTLQKICKMANLMGAKSTWVGLNPGIACSIDDFNLDLKHIDFASTIDDALVSVQSESAHK